tara:strand:- start:380 stop:514 length:135 start_codon:yes stop_codon:yes gene_type:complete
VIIKENGVAEGFNISITGMRGPMGNLLELSSPKEEKNPNPEKDF